jgi:hypothetical protein
MSNMPAPIVNKLTSLIRMLSSDHDGEVIAGARHHAHAEERIGGISEAGMKRLYDAGYDAGTRAAENNQHHGHVDFYNTDGTTSWHDIALFCQRRADRLRDKERDFVNDMMAQTVWREPTEKQEKWLKSIYYRLGGK